MLVILVIGLLIFGSRLPEVGRSLGRGLMEFKRGLRGMQDEMNSIESESDRMIDEELASERSRIEHAPEEEPTSDPHDPDQFIADESPAPAGDVQPDGEEDHQRHMPGG